VSDSTRRAAAIVLACCIGVGFLAAAPAEGADWSALAESKFFYTDDVFQFSAARRLALQEDQTQPTRVEVARPQDMIWEPTIEVTRTFSSGWNPTQVIAQAQGFVYTEHPIFNHGSYRLRLKQTFSPRTTALVGYRYTPDLFLGPNRERRSGRSLIEEERTTSHLWRAQAEHRFTDAWTGTLIGRYGLRFFNDPFAERDLTLWTLGPQVQWRMNARLDLTLGYLFERGTTDGRAAAQFTDDISYRNHFVSFGAVLQLMRPLALALEYDYQRNNFTTENVRDPNHGRQDNTHQGLGELRYAWTDRLTLSLGLQRTQRTSSKEASSFLDVNTWVGARYRF
jgi:hypothetical protein